MDLITSLFQDIMKGEQRTRTENVEEEETSAKRLVTEQIPPIPSTSQFHRTPHWKGGSPGREFVTVGGPYDVLFIVLRHVVFQVDRRSATPISELMRDELSEPYIYELINEFSTSGKKIRALRDGFHWVVNEPATANQVACVKLRAKIDEFRTIHASRLLEKGVRDVNILYSGSEAKIWKYIADRAVIVQQGGQPYHLWPYHGEPKTIGMSVIIRPETLEALFPADRAGITIVVNTEPAPKVASQPFASGSIFPYQPPIWSGIRTEENVEQRKKAIEKKLDEICTRRPRSNSKEDIGKGKKGLWHLYSSQARPSEQQPDWSSDSHPFAKHNDTDNHAWWQTDENLRYDLIQEWHEKTWNVDRFERTLSATPPSQSVVFVDFDPVPSLCDTFVSDRSYEWHEENIGKRDAEENARRLQIAENEFQRGLSDAKELGRRLRQVLMQSRLHPHNLGLQATLESMRFNMLRLKRDLINTRNEIYQRRKVQKRWCAYAGLDFESELTDIWAMCFPRQGAKPHQRSNPMDVNQDRIAPVQQGYMPLTQHTDAARGNHVEHPTEPPNQPTVPPTSINRQRRSQGENTIPFPKYEDPMIEPGTAPKITNNIVEKTRTRRRTAAGQNLATILEETGVHTHQNRASHLPPEKTEEQNASPLTPADSLAPNGDAKTGPFSEDKGGPGTQASNEPTVLGEDDVVEVALEA